MNAVSSPVPWVRSLRSSKPSERIRRESQRALHATGYKALRSIVCEWNQGILVLRGPVGSFFLKQLAQEVTRRVDGVTHIVNCVDVAIEPTEAKRSHRADFDPAGEGGPSR